MTVWGALSGGFVATVVMTVLLETASEVGLTRLDVAYLLGTALRRGRVAARALGYLVHGVLGLGFALGYLFALRWLDRGGWGAGALVGVVHGALAATVFFPLLLPALHPRLALLSSRRRRRSLVEGPGVLTLGYGRATPAVLLAAHAAYGTIVGGFAALSA